MEYLFGEIQEWTTEVLNELRAIGMDDFLERPSFGKAHLFFKRRNSEEASFSYILKNYYGYEVHCGINRFCIIDATREIGQDWVIKIPFYDTVSEGYSPDCDNEVYLYSRLSDKGLSKFFAKPIFVQEYGETPIYAMRRAKIDPDLNVSISKRYLEAHPETGFDSFNEYCDFSQDFLNCFYSAYGNDALVLFNILGNWGIADLHASNFGYINGLPVITDYAS